MDHDAVSVSIVSYCKSHPFVPISLTLSLLALGCGVVSILSVSPSTTVLPEIVAEVPLDGQVTTSITVDMEGHVLHPGLLILDNGAGHVARIADAIEKAGGLLPDADTEYVHKNINLASVITDGMKLYIPKKGENTSSGSIAGASTSSKVNVNTATSEELQKLRGVGTARAESIIANRPYGSVEDLIAKSKLPQSIIEAVKNDISF